MEQAILQRKTRNSIVNSFQLLFIILLTSCVSGVLTAQQIGIQADNAKNKWFIGLELGPRIFLADHSKQLDFADRLSGGADIYIGKWWSPILGTRVGGSWQTLKGASVIDPVDHNPHPSHALPKNNPYFLAADGGTRLWKTQFDVYQLYGDLLFNVSNLFEGLQENRFWSLIPYVGIGYLSTWDRPVAHELGMNLGLLNSLRVGPSVDLVLDVRGAMINDRFKTSDTGMRDWGGRPYDGILSVSLGVQFHFGSTGNPTSYHPVVSYVEPVAPPVRTEVVTEWKDVAADVLILFRIGQSTLSRDARVQLGFLAKLMHEYPESRYTITGYADSATGNPTINYRLSTERANRTKECLVTEFGIAASRLATTAAGGVENQYYNDPSLSRSVVIRPNKF